MESKKQKWRVPLGFLLAPVLPCALMTIPGTLATQDWNGAFVFIYAMVIASLVITLFVAVPIYLLLARFWRVGFVECLVSGTAIGALATLALTLIPANSNFSASDSGGATVIHGAYTAHGWAQNFSAMSDAAVLGAAIGFAFWLIAIWSPREREGSSNSYKPTQNLDTREAESSSRFKHYLISAVQWALLAFAAVCMYYDYTIVGVIAIFLVTSLIKRRHSIAAIPIKSWQWLVGLALVVAWIAATIWTFYDATHGHHHNFGPLIALNVVTSSLCFLWWGGLFTWRRIAPQLSSSKLLPKK